VIASAKPIVAFLKHRASQATLTRAGRDDRALPFFLFLALQTRIQAL
jgi:hypothetical protein